MKKSIIIPCIIIVIAMLFLTDYAVQAHIRNNGIIITSFDEQTENKFLAAFYLNQFDYVELSDVYYFGASIDPFYIVSFMVPKENVAEFEKVYLPTEFTDDTDSSLLPNRHYTFAECKRFDFEYSEFVYVKEHNDRDYYEYHFINTTNLSRPNIYSLIQGQINVKNYEKIGKLKSTTY